MKEHCKISDSADIAENMFSFNSTYVVFVKFHFLSDSQWAGSVQLGKQSLSLMAFLRVSPRMNWMNFSEKLLWK